MAQKQYEIMPNWCWNNLSVSGDEIQLREFVEKSTINIEENDEFSFNGTLPMPKEFKGIHKGSYTDENGVSHHRWREVDGKRIPVSDKEMKQLNEKYGHNDWYNWSIANWGTKWDASGSYIGHNDIDYFAVTFDTAWGPPIEWIDNIMQDFPDLCFELEYDEPGMCFGGLLQAQYKVTWEDAHWETSSSSDCCEGEVEFDDHHEATCLICGEECETIMKNVTEIKPAKTKIIKIKANE